MAATFAVRCPECKSTDVRPAHGRATDLIPLAFLMIPVRCRKCRKRFFNWRWGKIESEDEEEADGPLPPD
jgi:predicted Zn-ribbon and HTH transcriptional regulator